MNGSLHSPSSFEARTRHERRPRGQQVQRGLVQQHSAGQRDGDLRGWGWAMERYAVYNSTKNRTTSFSPSILAVTGPRERYLGQGYIGSLERTPNATPSAPLQSPHLHESLVQRPHRPQRAPYGVQQHCHTGEVQVQLTAVVVGREQMGKRCVVSRGRSRRTSRNRRRRGNEEVWWGRRGGGRLGGGGEMVILMA